MLINNTNIEAVFKQSLRLNEVMYIDPTYMCNSGPIIDLLEASGLRCEVGDIKQITEEAFILDVVETHFDIAIGLLKTLFSETSTIRTDFMYFQKVKDCTLEEVLNVLKV